MKQNYKLILLKDGRNILVSDKLTNVEAQEIEHYQTYDRKFFRIIGGTERTPTLIYSNEVRQELRDKYGWVDLEELRNTFKETPEWDFYEIIKAHQSITNKRFSLEELINNFKPQFDTFINNGGAIGSSEEWIQFQNIVEWFPKFLQSLQQPIELNVEVDMEFRDSEEVYLEVFAKHHNYFDNHFHHYDSGRILIKKEFEHLYQQPQITNNSILITKILN